ncbi:hypothetical protein MHBO_000843 [Bonamia ostreae]|uniref:Uncharacterized protein n=1 Tax=Bonamia ostreae TaxID=126728 RepID=A0ABV2AHP4_9EUKA
MSKITNKRFVKKLKLARQYLADEKYYETATLLKSLKISFSKISNLAELLNFMNNFVSILFNSNHPNLADEIALLYIEAYSKSEQNETSKILDDFDILCKIAALYSDFLQPFQKAFYLEKALKLMEQKRFPLTLITKMHSTIAKFYCFQVRDYNNAHRHFLESGDISEHAKMVVMWSLCSVDEVDVLVTKIVLDYLAKNKINESSKFLIKMLISLNKLVDNPLINFCFLAIKSFEEQNFELFEELTILYKPEISDFHLDVEVVLEIAKRNVN